MSVFNGILHSRCLDTYAFPGIYTTDVKVHLKCVIVNELERSETGNFQKMINILEEKLPMTANEKALLVNRTALFADIPIPKGTQVDVQFNLLGSGPSVPIGTTDHTGCVQGDVPLPDNFTMNQADVYQLTCYNQFSLRSEGVIMKTPADGYGIFTDFDVISNSIEVTSFYDYRILGYYQDHRRS
jgi:hypothetical protein